jgi:FkbM family methyltransferase
VFDPHQRLRLWLRARRIRRRGDPELARLDQLVGAGRRAIDIGANRGVYTYWLSRLARAVESFEPNPNLAARLARSGFRNVTVHNVALSDQAGAAELFVPIHRKGGLDDPGGRLDPASAGNDPARFPVTLARLDDFGFEDVDFIKIDFEFHEERVLDGGWQTITKHRPALLIELEERHRAGCLARVAGRFGELGYHAVFLDGGRWHRLDDLAPGQVGPSGRTIVNCAMLPGDRAAALLGPGGEP